MTETKIKRLDRAYTRELKRDVPRWDRVEKLRKDLVRATIENSREKAKAAAEAADR